MSAARSGAAASAASPTRSSTKILLRLSLILSGALLGLALAEVAVRVLQPHAKDLVIPGRLLAIDPDIGWQLAPSRMSVHRSQYFEVPYVTNALGLRDKPRDATKDETTQRILLYGESLVFGWGVPAEQRFSDRVEGELEGVEIWNHGVPAYGLDQEILLYEKTGTAVPADEVVFFVTEDTIERARTDYFAAKYKPHFVLQQDGTLQLVAVPKMTNALWSVIYDMLSPFHLPYFLRKQRALLREMPAAPAIPDGGAPLKASRKFDELPRALLRRALTVSKQRGHRMSLLLADLRASERPAARAFCDEMSIACLETSVERPRYPSDLNFGGDSHWNARAHELVAAELSPQIRERLPR